MVFGKMTYILTHFQSYLSMNILRIFVQIIQLLGNKMLAARMKSTNVPHLRQNLQCSDMTKKSAMDTK